MNTKSLITTLCAMALLLVVQCVNPGSGTETGNAKISGVLYNADGSRAAGVRVACIPRKHNPYSGANSGGDSTVTDDTGGYKFKTMPPDTYNILARSGDTAMAYIDPIVVASGTQPTHVPPDTLEAAGSIRGRIELEPCDDARNVFIIFLGTYVFRMADDSAGNFAISNLAEGRYRVRILANLLNYKVMDTAFTIAAGRDSVLPQPIRLEYTGIPIPQGLRIVYDTMKQIVTLIWDKPINGRKVKGYNIYRRNVDSNTTIAAINLHLVTDTVYSDSTGTQDQTYEYSVAVMDTNNSEGVKSTITQIRLSIKDFRIDSIGTKGTGVGQLNRPQSAASNKSYYVIIDWQDPFPSAARANIFDLQGNYIRTFTVRQDTSSDNLIGIKCAIDSMNTIYSVARDTTYTFDITGNIHAKYPVAIREILYSVDAIIKTGSAPQVIAINGNLVMVRNLMNGDTVSQFFIDGSYGGLSSVLSIDYNGNYFLGAYNGGYSVLKCGPTGTVLATWDSTVSKYMKFNVPQEIATDSAGRVYIDDEGNSRILIISNTGEYLGQCETFLNTQKWQGSSYNMAVDRSLFLNANNDVCLLECEVFSKLYIYHIPVK